MSERPAPDGRQGPPPRPARPRGRDDEPVLPDVTEDERDRGWGDDLYGRDGGDRDADWYRRQRPPHHE